MDSRGGIRAWVRVAGSILFASASAFPCVASATPGSDAQILYFEPLRISVPASSGRHEKVSAGDLRKLELTAYGRTFSVSVETNDTFHSSLAAKPSRSSLKLYRGAIDGLAGSWVRLATKGTDVHGMIWDGEQAYVVAPSDEVRNQLVPPLDVQSGTVIFRLADVLLDAPSMSCAASSDVEPTRASDTFETLKTEMQAAADASLATMRLELSVIGDALFLARHLDEQEARDSILVRLNNVDGIFSSQLGVHIQAPMIDVYTNATDPLSSENDPSKLLEELAILRRNKPELRTRGLTHLFTGRDLAGTTVGIGYVDSLCDNRYGSALTEVTHRGMWYESLIAAHEIGHNFGAVHDGQAGKACAGTPQGLYLMSPNVNGGETFSQCSRDLMRPRIAAAACITPLAPANVAIASDLGISHQPVATSFDWELAVTNRGGMAATLVRAEILVPPAVSVETADVTGGSCTSGAGYTLCTLGTIPGGTSRTVRLRLRSDIVAANAISAKVWAQNDASTIDNEGQGEINIDPEADIALTAEGPQQARVLEPFKLTFTLANTAVIDATGVRATIQLPEAMTVQEATFNGSECYLEGTTLTCAVPSLTPGRSATGTAILTAGQVGPAAIRVQTSGGYVDPNNANDAVELTVQVTSTSAVTASQEPAKSSGGGGSFHWSLVSLLGVLTLLRRARAKMR